MSTSKVDGKKRIVLPSGRPGDVFEIRQQAEGRFLLVRLEKPKRAEHVSREACMEAMRKAPLRPTMRWKQPRQLTREPGRDPPLGLSQDAAMTEVTRSGPSSRRRV